MSKSTASSTAVPDRKRIGVFFNEPGFKDYPFNDPEYWLSYHQFAAMVTKKGAEFWIVRDQSTYLGGNTFSGGWLFEEGEFRRHDEPVTLSVIYNKRSFAGDAEAVIVNHPELEELCTNKEKTYAAFPAHSPKTVTVGSRAEAEKALKAIHTERVVAKPIDKEGGEGVLVLPREEIVSAIPSYPYLMQEMIDTSCGIEGIAKGMHDLRIILVQGTPVLSYVREPKDGSFLANESQGGKITEISVSRLPKDVLTIIAGIDKALTKYPYRAYSVDLGRDCSGAWKLIELNSKPGLDPVGKYPGAEIFMKALTDLLLSV